MTSSSRSTLTGLAVALALAGCVNTGGIAPTAKAVDAAALVPDAAPAVDISDRWWAALADTKLNELVERGLAANPNLAAVELRIERAQAQAEAADAARQPHVDGSLDVSRQRYTANGAYSPLLAGNTRSTGSVLLNGSWELDVFGRQRAALDAAVGSRRAAEADYQAARVLLASNLVRQYVQLARLLEQRAVLERSLAQREEILGLVKQRVSAGLDTTVELHQGEGAVPELRASLEATDEQVALTRHTLAVLSGQGPGALDGWAPRLGAVTLVSLPQSVPADLLGRRADVAAARWRVEAATSDLQSAKAQFYPSINLVALAGFSSAGLGQLLEAGSRQIGAGPAVRLPIFDAGRLRANYKGRAVDVDAAVQTYNAAVLDAVREAADALSSMQSIARQQREQALTLASAESAYELALQRYRAGLGSYLTVLSVETNVLTQRRADNELKARALDTQALLVRALGGGYQQDHSA